MTDGQQLALDEMALIQRENPEVFEVIATTSEPQDRLRVKISVHIGPVDSKPGGLRLRERESFVIWIPPDYPFSAPHISVTHHRFQGFPHVCWRTSLCVYQSEQVEWNPADGMFGFFDRVSLWLHRASQNEMDPIEGPLEPPHYVTDSKEPPLVVRANSPAAPGTQWIGWACLNNSNRVRELNSWSAFAAPLPTDCQIVPAIFVAKPFPMEFPRKGEDIFSQLQSCGVDRNVVLALLTLSALFTPEGETGLIVVGLPMRRGLDGSPRQHIAAWVVSAETLRSMRMTIPVGTDTNEVRGLRGALAEAVFNVISSADIEWCRIYEDREEIVVRRDLNRPLAWFLGKRILILGCGALGSWAAEVIARASRPMKKAAAEGVGYAHRS